MSCYYVRLLNFYVQICLFDLLMITELVKYICGYIIIITVLVR